MNQTQPIQSIDDFENVYVSDYGRFDVANCASILGIEDLLSSDETIKKLAKETENPQHFMVELRQRELALDVLLPLIEKTQPITDKDLYADDKSYQAQCRKVNNLILLGMQAATGIGYKLWSVGYEELRAMTGPKRVKAIKSAFEQDKLKWVTLYERQTGNLTFETYKANKGELNEQEYAAVKSYNPSKQDRALAHKSLENVKGPGYEKIEEPDVEMVAKLVGALGNRVPREIDSDKPHSMWLFTESWIIQGKVYSYGAPKIQR